MSDPRIKQLTMDPRVKTAIHALLDVMEEVAKEQDAEINAFRLIYVAETAAARHVQRYSFGCRCEDCNADVQRAAALPLGPVQVSDVIKAVH